MKKFPLKVTMDEFGGREYYGDVAKKDRPTKKSKGKLGLNKIAARWPAKAGGIAIFYFL
ncbi:MAG: hypothetical protein HFI70_17255 [Lachnospiraceae bacterium]|nr:hypothetical protein [Lachnospiraceae bacterium]